MTKTTSDCESWTVAKGPFDYFLVQYKDTQGWLQVVPVKGDENEVTNCPGASHKFNNMSLYGLRGSHRVGPESVMVTTGEQGGNPSPGPQP